MMARGWVTYALFQVVWLCCAFGAARGTATPGVLSATTLALLHVAASPFRLRATAVLAACGAIGLIGESALAGSRLVAYATPGPIQGLAPVWIVALWIAFGTTLGASLDLLRGTPVAVQIVLGCLIGPLSYVAGERIGALTFAEPKIIALVTIAVLWGSALPMLLWVQSAQRSRPFT